METLKEKRNRTLAELKQIRNHYLTIYILVLSVLVLALVGWIVAGFKFLELETGFIIFGMILLAAGIYGTIKMMMKFLASYEEHKKNIDKIIHEANINEEI